MSLTPAMAVAKRELRFARRHGVWTVNGVTWEDVEAVRVHASCSATPQPFNVEQWTIVNESGGWFHPVHIHLVDGKVIAPEHQRRQAVRLGAGPQGRLLRWARTSRSPC